MIKLYHCPETRSMRSLWLLNELGAPFDLVEMPFDLKVLRSREYLAVHPLGRIPSIVDGDVTLYESGAICEYLCERYGADGPLNRPLGHPERYQWLQWIHFAETIAVHAASLVQQWVFITEEERSKTVINLETRRIGKTFDLLENHLRDREYLLQGGFSGADTSLGFSVYFVQAFVTFDAHPTVKAYYDRLTARPAFQKSLPKGQSKPLEWLLPRLGPPAMLNVR
jgi:glutathione S-transferase